MRARILAAVTLCVLLGALQGCAPKSDLVPYQPSQPKVDKPDYSRPLAPGEMALRKIGPEEYPDFSRGFDKREDLVRAIRYSQQYLAKPSSKRFFPYLDVTHERAVASLSAFLETLQAARSPQEFDQLIRQRFEVYKSIGWDRKGSVYYTGYYTPIFDGRLKPDSQFRYPLYRMPADLAKDEDGRTLGRRDASGQILGRYPTRREIEERGLLRGQEIAWLKDPFEAYVVTVQGSARLRLETGELYELGYAANNGHTYTPIAEQMIADGAIQRDELSLQTLLKYFKERPQDVPRYTWLNDRYVFFQPSRGGPFGSINVPVTPYRSIATDKEVFPRACLAFIDTTIPVIAGSQIRQLSYGGFALDQDAGGAIRAAGRCDVYMGIGAPAEAVAGRTGAEGALYYIFVRPGGGSAPARNMVPGKPPESRAQPVSGGSIDSPPGMLR